MIEEPRNREPSNAVAWTEILQKSLVLFRRQAKNPPSVNWAEAFREANRIAIFLSNLATVKMLFPFPPFLHHRRAAPATTVEEAKKAPLIEREGERRELFLSSSLFLFLLSSPLCRGRRGRKGREVCATSKESGKREEEERGRTKKTPPLLVSLKKLRPEIYPLRS